MCNDNFIRTKINTFNSTYKFWIKTLKLPIQTLVPPHHSSHKRGCHNLHDWRNTFTFTLLQARRSSVQTSIVYCERLHGFVTLQHHRYEQLTPQLGQAMMLYTDLSVGFAHIFVFLCCSKFKKQRHFFLCSIQ